MKWTTLRKDGTAGSTLDMLARFIGPLDIALVDSTGTVQAVFEQAYITRETSTALYVDCQGWHLVLPKEART